MLRSYVRLRVGLVICEAVTPRHYDYTADLLASD